jgi:AraC-type DNA-binding domain-containing proteins
MFSQRRLRFNEKYELHAPDNYSFIFMLTGSLRLCGDGMDEIVEENNIYSLGHDVTVTLYSLSDSFFLILCFDNPNILCNKFEITELEQYLPETVPDVPSLRMNEPIRILLESILFYLDHKMLCCHLHELKLGEWFFLMHNFYTKKQNATFFYPFYPLIGKNDSFKTIVREKAKKVTTVNELADACCMSPKTLTRKFKKVFNTTPKQWLLQQKKEQVMIELLLTQNKKELPEKLGFSSYSHLNYYCINQFGKSLKEL